MKRESLKSDQKGVEVADSQRDSGCRFRSLRPVSQLQFRRAWAERHDEAGRHNGGHVHATPFILLAVLLEPPSEPLVMLVVDDCKVGDGRSSSSSEGKRCDNLQTFAKLSCRVSWPERSLAAAGQEAFGSLRFHLMISLMIG